MKIIIVLAVILFVLLAVINGKRGVKAFFSLFVNFGFMVAAALLICRGVNPVGVAFIFSLGAAAFILFFINGINTKTIIAYLSILLVLLLISVFTLWSAYHGRLNGFGGSFNDTLILYSPNLSVHFMAVAAAVILIGLTGAITDTALDISTSLHEVYVNNRESTFGDLVRSGKNMGSDIMGTMVNTLFFVFIGEFIAFIMAYTRYHFTFAALLNDSLFLQEAAQLLIGNIGCILVIPGTILLQSFLYTSKKTPAFLKPPR